MTLLTIALVFLSCVSAIEGRPSHALDSSTVLADLGNSTETSLATTCRPTAWYDVCLFYFTNYIIHALSVRSLPGENFFSSFSFKFRCLLTPYTGVRRGLTLVLCASNLSPNDLQAAARSKALCMIARSKDWRPQSGDIIDGCSVEPGEACGADEEDAVVNHIDYCRSSSSKREVLVGTKEKSRACDTLPGQKTANAILCVTPPYKPLPDHALIAKLAQYATQPKFYAPVDTMVDDTSVSIHGLCKLAPGYEIHYVPGDMKVYPRPTFHHTISPSPTANDYFTLSKQTKLSSSRAIPRILFSLTQTISGGYQLYKVRGDQIDQFGYAAYGLTVIPYIIVSIINLVGSLLSKEYSSLYIVHSEIMDEMIDRGGMVDGVVGTIAVPKEDFGEADQIRGESLCKVSGVSLAFEGSQDALRCRISEDPTKGFAIVEPEPVPKPPPKARFRQLFHRKKGIEAAPKACSPNTIKIPSHLSFTRLPRLPLLGLLETAVIAMLCIAVFAPYIIIGVLTGFRPNNADNNKLTYAILWLTLGQAHGYLGEGDRVISRKRANWSLLFTFLYYGSTCVGGFVIVAQELVELGTCTTSTLWNLR